MLLPVAVAAATVLAGAQPAAASPGVDVRCLSRGTHYRCELVGNVDTNPILTSIEWYVNGIHRSSFDQKTTVAGLCADGQVLNIRVAIDEHAGDIDISQDPWEPVDTNTGYYTTQVECQTSWVMM
jgi:hypothetical protein